jgi:hypothetical protein
MNASGGGNKITGTSEPTPPTTNHQYKNTSTDITSSSDSGHGHEITEDKTAK